MGPKYGKFTFWRDVIFLYIYSLIEPNRTKLEMRSRKHQKMEQPLGSNELVTKLKSLDEMYLLNLEINPAVVGFPIPGMLVCD